MAEKKSKVSKKLFIETVVFNVFSDEKKTNQQLASDLGISERQFYRLFKKYAEEINEEIDDRIAVLRARAYTGLNHHLVGRNIEAIKTALKISGDLKERVEHTGKDGEPITVKIDM